MSEISIYIRNDIPPFQTHDSIAEVQDFFADEVFSHFPVVDDGVYLGSLSADDADTFDAGKTVGDFRYIFEGLFARKDHLGIDLLQLFAKYDCNLLAILDEQNRYIGYCELTDILKLFNETPFLREPGGIVVVEKGIKDFSMSQVAQIVEGSNGKLLGFYISKTTADQVQITIKTALGGMNEILQTFRRYEYRIVSEHQEDAYLNSLRERSDYLDKYLNI